MQKKTFKRVKRSILRELSQSMVLVSLVTILLFLILNSLLLTPMYIRNRQATMIEAYDALEEACEKDELYESSYRMDFEKICSNNNLSIMVMGSDASILLSSQSRNDIMMLQLYNLMFQEGSSGDYVLKATDQYTVEVRQDDKIDGNFLLLWGILPDGNIIIIRTDIQSMTDSAFLSNKLMVLVSIIAIILSVVVARLLARHITRPILNLTEISKKMADLDFEAKFVPSKHMDEVDVLGVHMNQMSKALENTILELKQANLDLARDIEILDKNEEMRREFLGNVSHELKTPIALIQGYAEGLVDGVSDDPESQKFYCDVIIDEAKKMNRLVQEILALNQLEFGKDKLHVERFDLMELVDSVITANRLLLEQNEITIHVKGEGPVYVSSDSFYTDQVITNYVSNAIHYAKYDKYIEISVEQRETEVYVSVFNTGDPIPEDSIDHVFEKFYKVDKARTREYGGSGIGLSVVRAVMDLLHKECGVENRENGVLFWFTLDK